MRILVAEDETIIRLDLKALLERAGFEVCAEARDGEEAVALARSEQPDLAVLDVKMPKLDGIEAARRILDERQIPIVMLTAYGQDELVQRAAEAGVFGYLVKPFREQDLLPAIRTARARHDELAALRDEAESLAEALLDYFAGRLVLHPASSTVPWPDVAAAIEQRLQDVIERWRAPTGRATFQHRARRHTPA